MVGVGENRLRTQASNHLWSERLDVRLRTDGNESRGADVTVRGMNDAGAPKAAVRIEACADCESTVGGVAPRRGRGLERRELFGGRGAEPVVVHRSKTSSFLSPSVRRIAAITG